MINKEKLEEYELEQQIFLQRNSNSLNQKRYIESAIDLYPEVKNIKSVCYIRGNVPMKAMLLLYEKIVVFVPPATKECLERRFGLPYDEFIELCRSGLVQPLIGHAVEYTDDIFIELLKLKPPSVWARGVGSLSILQMDDVLEEAKNRLPVKKIAMLPLVRREWREHFGNIGEGELTERIIREISTLYADLCVFGYKSIADKLAKELKDEKKIIRQLKFLNEILTYPILFGLGGSPNYSYDKLRSKSRTIKLYLNEKTQIVPLELLNVLEDIGLSINSLDINKIIEFRSKNIGKYIIDLLYDFEENANLFQNHQETVDTVLAKAFILKQELQNFNKEIIPTLTNAKKIEKQVDVSIKIGCAVLGGLLGVYIGQDGTAIPCTVLGSIGAEMLSSFIPEESKDILTQKVISKKFSAKTANLWKINKIVGD